MLLGFSGRDPVTGNNMSSVDKGQGEFFPELAIFLVPQPTIPHDVKCPDPLEIFLGITWVTSSINHTGGNAQNDRFESS